jgi:histidinol-phosphate aminotransferase
VPRDGFFRASVDALVPYEPGKPVEEVQRELGLERVVKLASNEGPFPPFPEAIEAMERAARDSNRYPDGGAYRLREAIAERHDVPIEQVAVGAGADGVIDCLSQAVLDPGDEIVCCWPSFASYVVDAAKAGAVARRIPLHDYRYDLDAMLEAIGPRTKIAYVCHPNNPTGTASSQAEIERFLDHVPDHVLTVIDQAYFEYATGPGYPDGVDYLKGGANVLVLRTFSKIYGLAGLRVGYGVGPEDVVAGIGKVRRAFDITTIAQEAAIASIGDDAEVARRRAINAEGRTQLAAILREAGLEPAPGAAGNFLYADVGDDARPLFDALLHEGVIVRPLHGFGAPGAIRVTVGTPEENVFFGDALGRVLARAG